MQTVIVIIDINSIREAARLLKPGGRYGIHELCLQPDDVNDSIKEDINQALSSTIRVGARPLTISEWIRLLEEAGFIVTNHVTAPMHLLELKRIIQDEGFAGFLRFIWNVAPDPTARRRILDMRAIFQTYSESLCAVTMVGVKNQPSRLGKLPSKCADHPCVILAMDWRESSAMDSTRG